MAISDLTAVDQTPSPEAASNLEERSASCSNWKLVLAYDGTDFDGWQVQPCRRTIQGELASAIQRVIGERVLPQGSGRTDAGVHALAQVASFRLAAAIPPENLQRALNRVLPAAIRILTAEHVAEDFHARHSAIGKTYAYRIFRAALCTPWLARYVYCYDRPLDLAAMERAAAFILGEHDFTSFAATDPDRTLRETAKSTAPTVNLDINLHGRNIRTVQASAWQVKESQGLLTYTITGSGFLHHMVRNLVGTFLDVGRGIIPAESLPWILATHSRKAAGPTAPARGLFLASVEYPRND
ncbi:MAG TPA: tRNA pseudouridine(38-40) synthase TruA [Acidisarcina sp.]